MKQTPSDKLTVMVIEHYLTTQGYPSAALDRRLKRYSEGVVISQPSADLFLVRAVGYDLYRPIVGNLRAARAIEVRDLLRPVVAPYGYSAELISQYTVEITPMEVDHA